MRTWILVAILLAGGGIGLFVYKVVHLHYPLTASDAPGTWRVEQVINVTGDGARVVVDAPLPRTSSYQRLLAEELHSGPLRFGIEETITGRRGRWTGRLDGVTTLTYEVTFATAVVRQPLPEAAPGRESADAAHPFEEATESVQADDPAIASLSRELRLPRHDRVRLAQETFSFVSREIGSLHSTGRMDALSVVREGRGDELGRARLFCALARHNGLPCRIVTGLAMRHRRQETMRHWNEVRPGDAWVPFDTIARLVEVVPPNRLVLSISDDPGVQSSGTGSLSYRYYAQSETETYADLIRRQVADSQHVLDRLSLLLLPVQTQQSLRYLLLVPLGALVMAVLRNMVGIRTFGTFMPMLIALAMTTTGVLLGTGLLAGIITCALVTRVGIKHFDLLLAPRIAFILTLVVLLMVMAMVVGDRMGLATVNVGAFPFVIMTMIVERISVTLEEEGVRNTLQRLASTIFAIYATYAVIQAQMLQSLFLVFPELLLVILGALLVIGRYTGYRLNELIRFRELIAAQAARREPTPPPTSPS